jgi:hypothetical protein
MTATNTHPASPRSIQATMTLGLISGAALVVDTVTIAVINRAFDPLDSMIFLVGFVGMLLTAGALSIYLSRDKRGRSRVVTAIGIYLTVAAALGTISFGFDQLGRLLVSASNKGLHGEWSFFSIGVSLLIIASWAARRQNH